MKYTPEQYAKAAQKYGIWEGPYHVQSFPGDMKTLVRIAGGGTIARTCQTYHGDLHPDTAERLAEIAASIPDLLIERDELKAENERLRKALKQIADGPVVRTSAGPIDNARTALQGGAA
jgi:hypothetical protein